MWVEPEELYVARFRPYTGRERYTLYALAVGAGLVSSVGLTLLGLEPILLRVPFIIVSVVLVQHPFRARFDRRRAREAGRPVRTTRWEQRSMRRDLERMAAELRD